jgi:hypothetical protein
MRTFDIEGTRVHYRQLEGKRVWGCSCDYFSQRRNRSAANEVGYCPHIAVAIVRCIQDGTINPADEAAGEFELFVNHAHRFV